MVKKTFCFLSDPESTTIYSAEGMCALTLKWNKIVLAYLFLVIPDLPHSVYVGSDVLVQLGVQVDTMHNVLCSLTTGPEDQLVPDPDCLQSGQTIPGMCQVVDSQHIPIPTFTQDVLILYRPTCLLTKALTAHKLSFNQPLCSLTLGFL